VPAIQPFKLRQQIALLVEKFEDPPGFIRGVHDLLEFYADRAQRPGQAGIPSLLTPAYRVQGQVIKQIILELIPLVSDNPDQCLILCDSLWKEEYFELKQLSAMLLGRIPQLPLKEVITRIQIWLTPHLDRQLIDEVLLQIFQQLHQKQPLYANQLIQEWLTSPKSFHQKLGLFALLIQVRDQGFENLPIVYRLIQPFVLNAPSELRPDLLDIIIALAHRSPKETAFFLKELLSFSDKPGTSWVIRQVGEEFPEDIKKVLKEAVRKNI
jgi:hypothetical protein